MGNNVSFCPEPIQGLLTGGALWGGGGGNHPTGVVVKGVEYTTIRLVGEGGYAFVYEGHDNSTGRSVALKRYCFPDNYQQQRAVDEMALYQSLCPNDYIVEYYDSEVVFRSRTQQPEMWVVMEYCNGPSLQEYINTKISAQQTLPVQTVYAITNSVVHSIAHLHSQSPPVSHWDIKPDNFLYNSSGALKLCDFGSASRVYYLPRDPDEIAQAETELEARMTLLYRSPESLDLWAKQRVDTKADIWALGVLVYVLVFQEMPFEANTMEIMDGVPKRYRDNRNPCPSEYEGLMGVVRSMMLVKKPSERADIFTVSEELAKLSSFPAIPRPRPGFQSAQAPRFRDLA